MEGRQQSGFLNELKMIAVLRLYLPDILIPASLDVDGIRGLEELSLIHISFVGA